MKPCIDGARDWTCTRRRSWPAAGSCVASGSTHEVGRFPTTTPGLLALADWLEAEKITHVAMEATGVYWKPVWHILVRPLRAGPGQRGAHPQCARPQERRERCDLDLRSLGARSDPARAFVPPQPIQELRDLTRTRKELTREIVRHTQRIQAVLEEANIKLTSVITDILGMSGRRILKAIMAGETRRPTSGRPRQLAPCGATRCAGRSPHRPHPRSPSLSDRPAPEDDRADRGDDSRVRCTDRGRARPFREAVERLSEIPGISRTVAEIIIAEIGCDMSQFPSADHLISWAGLCPRLDESAGKRRSTRIRKGATWLKPVLVQSALAAGRKKNSSFKTRYHSLKGRIGPKKAAIAVAANLLRVVYHMLKDGTCYQDLGESYRRPRNPARAAANLAKPNPRPRLPSGHAVGRVIQSSFRRGGLCVVTMSWR